MQETSMMAIALTTEDESRLSRAGLIYTEGQQTRAGRGETGNIVSLQPTPSTLHPTIGQPIQINDTYLKHLKPNCWHNNRAAITEVMPLIKLTQDRSCPE